jgi:hypothetical protein
MSGDLKQKKMTAHELVTKQDLLEVKKELIEEIKKMILPRNNETLFYKSKDVKQMLHCSDSTLQYYRESGKLQAKKIGGTYLYPRYTIENLFGDG